MKRICSIFCFAAGVLGTQNLMAQNNRPRPESTTRASRIVEVPSEEGTKAADAYALAGDADGQARALAKSGEVDRLEDLLGVQQIQERGARRRQEAHAQIHMLITSGRRREALEGAKNFAREQPDDNVARELWHSVEARKLRGPVVRITLAGTPLTLVIGDEVVVGRTEGALTVASHAISRRHVTIRREGNDVVVTDLGSRNGTLLRGNRLKGAASVGEGLQLMLGGEVPLRMTRSSVIVGAVEIEIRSERYIAALGPARMGIGAWRIETANDGWLELVTEDTPAAVLDGMTLGGRTTLLAGDAIATSRNSEPILRIPG